MRSNGAARLFVEGFSASGVEVLRHKDLGVACALEGFIFDIQRFSLHDGPGIRTTVFLKGCPLRCLWCHNPEGLDIKPQIRLVANRCTGCGKCALACEHGCHDVSAEGHTFRAAACVGCNRCVDACPVGALEVVGRRISVEDVLAVVRRDVPFYEHSGGGMTLSGGEPLAQPEFAKGLLQMAKAEGINTAIETACLVPTERIEEVAPFVDLFMVDIKHTDDTRHRTLTGVSNALIMRNISFLVSQGWPLLLRVPWVPTHTGEDAFLEGLERYLLSFGTPPTVEFMPYHRLGTGKWAALGGGATMADDIPAATAADTAPWAERLRAAGIPVKG